ncbi:hypothetical protein [Actinokineospora sp. HUAS TT18]|uniref:hypothetical protein n=1 Tax=Actinokineospora sp. HUAS TT18 TaxID=3447451 RepID=UPI003F51D44F
MKLKAAFTSFMTAAALALGLVVAVAPSAAADDVSCSGNLQILKTFRTSDGTALGEVQLYTPSAGRHCAKLVKLGPTRGVSSEIGIQLRKCTQTTNTGTCTVVPNVGGIDNGSYRYEAGPVGVIDGANCFRVTADMFWNGLKVFNKIYC